MPSFTYLTAALAASTAVIANPINLQERSGQFSVKQVEGPKFLKNGALDKVRLLQKLGKPVPQHLLDAANRVNDVFQADSASGSVSANPSDQYDSSYLSPVNVGGTTLNLDFDTGSSDLWVFSSLQPKSQLSGHNYYTANPAKKLAGYTWKISYGDGSGASGTVYADKVVVGGVTATRQAVEAATSISTQFAQNTGTDGLLGLAMSSLNTVKPQQQTTFFDTVRSQLAQPLFAADLRYHAAGSYDFGFIDTSKFSGQLNWVNADTSQGWWGVTATGYSVGGSASSAQLSGILDTGTTLLYTDDSVVSAYYSQVNGAQNDNNAGGYTFPCNAQLPDFSLTIGGVSHTVPGQYINYAPTDSSGQTCFGGIQSDDSVGMSIFGDIFLKSQYVVFEMASGSSARIGLAQQA